MKVIDDVTATMKSLRVLKKHRTEPLYARTLVYALWTIGFGFFFAIVSGVQTRRIGAAVWWLGDVPGHMVVSGCVSLCFFLGFRGFEKLAPQRWLDTITGWRDWRAAVFFTSLSIVCSLTGVIVGLALVDTIWLTQGLQKLLAKPGFWGQFLLVSAIISIIIGLRYRSRWRQELMQARVTEAQLRLLQGQIEPHFLFNTLANVQSLIDFDPERAKLMLERFTDYLRASLGQMRGESTTLAQEFAMLEAYLCLMQLRMGDRLRVEQALPADLASLALPPLLLQPLVENAIHHGLEPKVGGGTIAVSARQAEDRLVLQVEDDGQGLDAPKRRGGNGVALSNIRERLTARFGPLATLELLPRDGGGTLSRIQIPLASFAKTP